MPLRTKAMICFLGICIVGFSGYSQIPIDLSHGNNVGYPIPGSTTPVLEGRDYDMGGVGSEIGVRLSLAFAFNDEEAVFTEGVVGLVPLEFFVADKALFVGPVGGVRAAVLVELVRPDEFVPLGRVNVRRAGLLRCGTAPRRGRAGQQENETCQRAHKSESHGTPRFRRLTGTIVRGRHTR